MTDQNIDSRVTVITGAGSGIGRAMAHGFARAGNRVVVVDIDEDSAAKTVAELGTGALAARVDISDPDAVEQLVTRTIDAYGRIDVLCNNAGIMDRMALPADTTVDQWKRVIDINLTGTFLLTKAVLPHMLGRGSGAIVNTASEAGIRGGAAGIAYTSSKHGVIGLTRSIAWAHAGDGIRCNAILPGPTMTGIAPDFDPQGVARLRPILELNQQRLAQPDQMAAVAVFLASDAASFVNGAIVPVDAGWSAG
ncbi:SDR family NAD(P)-dependent oxidoreductase [Nocardia flavorosea]|uniref:SDR family oxidoreductase n=1 Tax=Nocardia flavorosea TaxID=53429 RepID=A0A846YR88_9NOCA|nr:SDR family oxidoreductase [Nocardia flavorosea]NKY60080.1 SDR family oxidoreductase [Nocardia flavorosea]